MRRLGLALVGCGYVAQNDYLPFMARSEVRERIEVVAVCDIDGAMAERARASIGAREAYTDYRRALENPTVEALAVLTPVPFHYEQVKAAILAGRHVYVQKTMTETVAEATELLEMAWRFRVLLTAAPGMMISPFLQLARRIISSGAIGKVCYARARGGHSGYERNTDPGWRYQPGGGPVVNTGVYALHCLTGLLGGAKRVSAFSGTAVPVRYWEGRAIEVGIDDNTVFNLDFGNACYGQVDSSYQIIKSETPQVEVYATKGVISAQSFGWARHPRPIAVWSADPIDGLVKDEESGWWVAPANRSRLAPEHKHTTLDLLHFADCLIEGREPINTGEHARHVIEIIRKGYESAASGCTEGLETNPFPASTGRTWRALD